MPRGVAEPFLRDIFLRERRRCGFGALVGGRLDECMRCRMVEFDLTLVVSGV